MKKNRSISAVLPTAAVLLLAACSGNMGSGVTPPVSAPAAGGPVTQSVGSTAVGGVQASPSASPSTLSKTSTVKIDVTQLLTLPSAAEYSGTVCIGPATASSLACAAGTPAPSATPSATPAASSTPATILITPRPKASSLPDGLRLTLATYPTGAPQRDDGADDGAVNPLLTLDLESSTDLATAGLDAFTFTLPKEHASSEHHYALVLFDHDVRTTHGSVLSHKKSLHGSAVAVSAQLTGQSLSFVDNSTTLTLTAKHHYTLVLYSDTVTPTPGPSTTAAVGAPAGGTGMRSSLGAAMSQASGSPVASPTSTGSSMPTPIVTYPNAGATP
jgi:hypothetical protein